MCEPFSLHQISIPIPSPQAPKNILQNILLFLSVPGYIGSGNYVKAYCLKSPGTRHSSRLPSWDLWRGTLESPSPEAGHGFSSGLEPGVGIGEREKK